MEYLKHPMSEHILELIGLLHPDRSGGETQALAALMEEMSGNSLICRAGGEKGIIYASQGLLRLFLCESMEDFLLLTGGSFRGMISPEDLEAVEDCIQRDPEHMVCHIVRKDGARRWLEGCGRLLHSGSPEDLLYVSLSDVTERIERQLEIIDGLSIDYDSVFYADLEQNTLLPCRLDGRMVPILERRRPAMDYAGGIQQDILPLIHPEDRERAAWETSPGYIRQRLEKSGACFLNYRAANQEKAPYLQIRCVKVGQQEQPGQLVISCRRVDEELRCETEQKQLLEEALHNAQLSITAKNTFLSNMSHDMRTPLNAVFGFTALARKRRNSPEAVEGYLDRIEASSRQLLDLIDKVLKLSWMDSNEVRAEEHPCLLGEILEEVYSFLLPQAEEKDIGFTLDCSGVRHNAVYGDREKLGQLVMYLANNAVTYTPSGGNVFIIAREDEELPHSSSIYRIIVQDNGIGISEEFLQQIFEPFTRERNTTFGGIHGVGLGLTIARNLADLLGGAIEVSSAIDKGSTFTVTLRLRTQPPADVKNEQSGCRILLVEDNEINLEIASEILRSLDFQLDTAENGAIALEKVRISHPGEYDLILMDIQMPVMDGWEAARAIRALPDPDLANIPIVALSANVFDSDVQRSLDSGMDAHLAKPIDVPLLLQTIEGITARGRPEKTDIPSEYVHRNTK